jgi:hypothetical protein
MKKISILILVGLLLTSFGMSGCGGKKTTVQAQTTTLGQELTDLQKAYEQGIITEKEYNKLKKEIMEKY